MPAMSDKDKNDRKKVLEGRMAATERDKKVYNESPYSDKRMDKQTRSNFDSQQAAAKKELSGLNGRPPQSRKWIEK